MRRILIAVLLAGAIALAQAPAPQGKTQQPWKMKFVAGPSWPGADSFEVFVNSEAITLLVPATRKSGAFARRIAMSDIRAIVYSPTRFGRADGMGYPDPVGYGLSAAAGAAAYLIVGAFASGMHGQHHYFSIAWEQDGVDQEILLEAPKETANQIAEEIGAIAGPRWMNLEQRAAKAEAEIAANRERAFQFTLAQPASAAKFKLAAGQFTAVPVAQTDGSALLYIFEGQSSAMSAIKAIIPVELGTAEQNSTDGVKLTTTQPIRIVEIAAGNVLVRVKP